MSAAIQQFERVSRVRDAQVWLPHDYASHSNPARHDPLLGARFWGISVSIEKPLDHRFLLSIDTRSVVTWSGIAMIKS
jgi:hypothetical protein